MLSMNSDFIALLSNEGLEVVPDRNHDKPHDDQRVVNNDLPTSVNTTIERGQ